MKRIRILLVTLSFVVFTGALAGWGLASDRTAEASQVMDPRYNQEIEPRYARTIVQLEADGTTTVRTELITASEQRRQVAAREAALAPSRGEDPSFDDERLGTTILAISVDSSCNGASMWMFDQPNLTGNEICFTGQGYTDLHNYTRLVCANPWGPCWILTWAGATASYWAGVDAGIFRYQGQTAEIFNPYDRVDNASSSVRTADGLQLYIPPIP